MNKRIQELALTCGAWHQVYGDRMFMIDEHFDIQKFARLIVQECMACSTWVGKMNTNSVEPAHTAHAVNQRIKQHFGVEE
jgi:hypothetical protein